jgi:hypothetical protein
MQQIQSTIQSFGLDADGMQVYAWNLCLLHTQSYLNEKKGYLELEYLPKSYTPFIEAGLIRVRQNGSVWHIFPPNRFLVKIFNSHVKWFTWENIQDLVANIKVSASSNNIKGKVFEYLFALELLNTSDSALCNQITKTVSIRPSLDWKPKIKMMSKIEKNLDPNPVYVIVDPDYSKCKTDVMFLP